MASESFREFLHGDTVRILLLFVAVAVLCAIGLYVIARIRDSFRGTDSESGSQMTNFRELHDRGELSDEEYRNIKAMLAEKMRQQFLGTDNATSTKSDKSGKSG